MPGHDSSEGGGGLRFLVEKLFSPQLREAASDFAGLVMPKCVCCRRKAIPLRCFRCGSYTCVDHGWHSVGHLSSLCQLCKDDLIKLAGEVTEDMDPWEVLGVESEVTTKEEVDRAFRLRAKECHPDFFPGDLAKAREWQQLQWAREAILEELAEET